MMQVVASAVLPCRRGARGVEVKVVGHVDIILEIWAGAFASTDHQDLFLVETPTGAGERSDQHAANSCIHLPALRVTIWRP